MSAVVFCYFWGFQFWAHQYKTDMAWRSWGKPRKEPGEIIKRLEYPSYEERLRGDLLLVAMEILKRHLAIVLSNLLLLTLLWAEWVRSDTLSKIKTLYDSMILRSCKPHCEQDLKNYFFLNYSMMAPNYEQAQATRQHSIEKWLLWFLLNTANYFAALE